MTPLLAAGSSPLVQTATVAVTALLLVVSGLGKHQLEWRPGATRARPGWLARLRRHRRRHRGPRSR